MSFYPVKRQGNWGYIDKSCSIVIEPNYKVAGPFSEGVASVMFSDFSLGYINESGDPLFSSFDYECLFELSCGFGIVQDEMYKNAYIRGNGTLLTEFIFDNCKSFKNDVGVVAINGKYGVIDCSKGQTNCSAHFVEKCS